MRTLLRGPLSHEVVFFGTLRFGPSVELAPEPGSLGLTRVNVLDGLEIEVVGDIVRFARLVSYRRHFSRRFVAGAMYHGKAVRRRLKWRLSL